jgi:hypothetical protein
MNRVVLVILSLSLLATTAVGCAKTPGTATPSPTTTPAQGQVIECIITSGGPFYPEFAEGFFINPFIEYLIGHVQQAPALKGRMELKIYPNAQLYNQNDAQTALANGSIHMTYGGPHFYEQWNPAWKLLEAPGLLDSWEHFLRVMNTTPFKDLEKDLASKGITILNWAGQAGNVYIFTSKRIERIEDLKGMKIRYFGGEGQAKAVNALGAEGIFLPYTEVVTALQTKQIDGVITDVTGGAFFYELYRYCPNMLPYVIAVQPVCNAVNTKWYEALPSNTEPFNPGVRESFDRVFQGIRADGYYVGLESWALGAWKGMGCYVAPYDKAQDQKLKEIMRQAQQSMFAGIDPKYMQAIDSAR